MKKLDRSTSVDVTLCGVTLRVTGYFYPGTSGRFSGPPERCYPDEPGEFEVAQVFWQPSKGPEQEIPFDLLGELYLDQPIRVSALTKLEELALERSEELAYESRAGDLEDQAYERARDKELGL